MLFVVINTLYHKRVRLSLPVIFTLV